MHRHGRIGSTESDTRHIHDEVTIAAAELDPTPLPQCLLALVSGGGWVCRRLLCTPFARHGASCSTTRHWRARNDYQVPPKSKTKTA
jgi:hypothetical protein